MVGGKSSQVSSRASNSSRCVRSINSVYKHVNRANSTWSCQVYSLQFSSSEPSPQSFWLSHLQWSGMQLLFSQRNSWGPQVFSSFSSGARNRKKSIQRKMASKSMNINTALAIIFLKCNHRFLRVSLSKSDCELKTQHAFKHHKMKYLTLLPGLLSRSVTKSWQNWTFLSLTCVSF